VSIDSFFYVPAGTLNLPLGERRYLKYKSASEYRAKHDYTPHQVAWVAGGVIDEQYFFEDPQDARWFFIYGWKFRDVSYDSRDSGGAGIPPHALWIDGEEIEDADNNVPLSAADEAALAAYEKTQAQKDDEDAKRIFGTEAAE
jgi:hypothetical protein